MTRPLYPPLAVIERDLTGAAQADDALIDGAALLDANAPVAAAPHEVPAHLAALMRRQVAARASYPPQPPAVGQILRLTHVPAADGARRPLERPCAVLLGAAEGRRWRGWLVAREADYASDRDLVLQEEDGVVAPEAGMVQAWNPVTLALHGDEAILARLGAHRLGAVLKLGEAGRAGDGLVAPRPGRIGVWDLDDETTVVTGTPLGDDTDPRVRYQALYRGLAAALQTAPAPAARPAGAAPGWMARLRAVFVRPAWTFGALALCVFQAAWLAGGRPDAQGDDLVYRGIAPLGQAEACEARIRVMFKLDTPYADVVLALRRVDAILVSGPSETGEIWLSPPPEQAPEEIARALMQSHLVERADVIAPERSRCKR